MTNHLVNRDEKAREMVARQIREHAAAIEALGSDPSAIFQVTEVMIRSLEAGGKVLTFGNGGSASDAQHLVGELVGRFKLERRGLAAIALTSNSTNLTAIGNDFDFRDVFARQIEALGKEGDVAIGLSTSGNSPNVIAGLEMASKLNIITVALTGGDGGKLKSLVDVCLNINASDTPRIQEAHITAIHIICELVESELASR